MDKKVFITRKIPQIAEDMLRQNGFEVEAWPKERAPKKRELIKILKKGSHDAVLCLLTDEIDRDVLEASPRTKIYANYAAGFNNIDIEEAKRRGIAVTNTPGVSGMAVAEHTVALIFALTTRLVEGDRQMREGKYAGWSPMNLVGTHLHGKILGLVGVGNIGGEVARMMHSGFGARILYYDVVPNKNIEEKYGAEKVSMEDLLKRSDIVSLHVPLLDSTRHLIDERTLKLMKPSAFLINTSRGPVVDEAALVKALEGRTLAGAGLDVYEFEPRLTKGLARLPNVVLTPHIASARQSVRNDMARIAAENIIDLFAGRIPRNKVN